MRPLNEEESWSVRSVNIDGIQNGSSACAGMESICSVAVMMRLMRAGKFWPVDPGHVVPLNGYDRHRASERCSYERIGRNYTVTHVALWSS